MRRLLVRSILLASLVALGDASFAHAYKRLKVGPLEFVPTFSVELRQHSNVYLSSDDQPASDTTRVSGFLLDVRPGMLLTLKPNLEKRIRGLYMDIRVAPSLVLMVADPQRAGLPGKACAIDLDESRILVFPESGEKE